MTELRDSTTPSLHPPTMAFSITFVLFPGVTQLDFTGPAQVLCRIPGAEVAYAGAGAEPIPTDCGFSVLPTIAISDVDSTDLICVPGGFGVVEALGDRSLIANVQRLSEGCPYITSVCTGAFVLGSAGLLKGKKATTHWAYHDLLPLVGAIPARTRVVRDGNTLTGGGVTAGIDFGLTIVAEIAGEQTARAIATAVEYDPAPPFGRGVAEEQPDEISTFLEGQYQAPVERMRRAIANCMQRP